MKQQKIGKPSSKMAAKDVRELNEKMDLVIKNFRLIDTNTAYVLIKTERRLDAIEETINTKLVNKDDFQVLLNHIDAFSGTIKDFGRKAVLHDHRLNEFEPKLEDHEKRLSALEIKTA